MKEERMEILNMLKEGTITAEQAERLLQALDDGEKKERSSEDERNRRKRHGHSKLGDFGPFQEVGRVMAGIGKSIGSAVTSVVDSVPVEDIDPDAYAGYDTIPFSGETELPENATLTIRQHKNQSSTSSDITMRTADTNMLAISYDRDVEMQLKVKGTEYVIFVDTDAELSVPESCARVSVGLFDGDISIERFSVPVSVTTMSGDISIDGAIIDGKCTTMSGDISAERITMSTGRADFASMSGDITLSLRGPWDGVIEATSMSGDVTVDIPDANVEDQSHLVSTHVRVRVGNEQSTGSVKCSTMSGDISVEIDHSHGETHAYTG